MNIWNHYRQVFICIPGLIVNIISDIQIYKYTTVHKSGVGKIYFKRNQHFYSAKMHSIDSIHTEMLYMTYCPISRVILPYGATLSG